jgi:hypothetical protein
MFAVPGKHACACSIRMFARRKTHPSNAVTAACTTHRLNVMRMTASQHRWQKLQRCYTPLTKTQPGRRPRACSHRCSGRLYPLRACRAQHLPSRCTHSNSLPTSGAHWHPISLRATRCDCAGVCAAWSLPRPCCTSRHHRCAGSPLVSPGQPRVLTRLLSLQCPRSATWTW